MTKKKGIVTKWVITIVLFLFGLICIYPFLFTVSSAFKPTGEVLSTPPAADSGTLHAAEHENRIREPLL